MYMRIKNIPNIITIIRIILSINLLFMTPLSSSFFIVYIICGLSDVMDGYIARKTNKCTVSGAVLDSVADIVFFTIVLIIFIPLLSWTKSILIFIGVIVWIRITAVIIGFLKHHTLVFLHTYLNKLSGFLLFLFPMINEYIGTDKAAFIICIVAGAASVVQHL